MPLRLLLILAVCAASALPAQAHELPFARERGARHPGLGFHMQDLGGSEVWPEVYIIPRRPGQNRVRWYGFEFKEVLLPQLPGAGVRLYYYRSERPAAEIAAGMIRDEYLRLARAFEYLPEREIPYILYATHLEFQATNAFPISEGVLGVMSPAELTLSLPFFGDLEQYRHTSAHELAHQFTVQLVRSSGEAQRRPHGLGGFPLWFIEGLAEYAAFGGLDPDAAPSSDSPRGVSGPAIPGLDPEAEAWARDLLYQSDPFVGYLIPPFYSDFPMGYVHTYKLGQVRLAFLGATFGRETVLWLLKNASLMGSSLDRGSGAVRFPDLVRLATGFDEAEMDRLFADWIRRRYLPAYDAAQSRVPAITPITNLPNEPELVVSSPDASTLLIRGFDRSVGRGSLFLVDAEDPSKSQLVVHDSRPGLESLHLISRRTFTLGNGRIAWIGRAGEGDVLHVAKLHRAPEGAKHPYRVEDKQSYELVDVGLIEGGDPTFSPDGEFIAFTAVGATGFKDVYVLPVFGRLSEIRQVTKSPFSESELYWNEEGIYLVSDASPEGDTHVFLLDPDTGTQRLVIADRSRKESPTPTPSGLLFASDRGGRWDLHRIEDGTVYRLTDISTQIRSPAPGPNGEIYGIMVHGGRFRLVRVPPAAILRLDPRRPIEEEYDSAQRALPRLGLPEDVPDYRPFDHLAVDMGGVAVGTQSVAVGGVSFSDLLRDKVIGVQLAVYGSLDFTDASIVYLDRSRRTALIAGLFHTFQPKRDRTFSSPAFPGNPDFYLEREYGVMGGISYPFNRFERTDWLVTLEGVTRNRFTDKTGMRSAVWDERTGGTDMQLMLTGSYGYDTIRFHPWVGPIAGSSAIVTLGGGVLPTRLHEQASLTAFTEIDLQHYLYLGARTTLWGRLAGGSAIGGRFSRQFYLSSVDNLRGYHWSDDRLLGTHYYVGNLELSFPLDWLVRLAFFEGLRGVGGVDFGGVHDQADELWNARSLNLVTGVDFLLGPLALRLLFGYPIQIGPTLPSDGWVTNLALRLRY